MYHDLVLATMARHVVLLLENIIRTSRGGPVPDLVCEPSVLLQVQTTTMCISVSLSGSVVLGCLFAPKVHIILFQPQKNVCTLRVATTRFSVTTGPGSSFSQGTRTETLLYFE